jgi:hypothetical protein
MRNPLAASQASHACPDGADRLPHLARMYCDGAAAASVAGEACRSTVPYALSSGHRLASRLHREKKADSFYLSPEWREFIAGIIPPRGPRCEDPDHDPDTPRVGRRIFGDHIIERKDGSAPFDPFNIMLRCGSCHTRKAPSVEEIDRGVVGKSTA